MPCKIICRYFCCKENWFLLFPTVGFAVFAVLVGNTLHSGYPFTIWKGGCIFGPIMAIIVGGSIYFLICMLKNIRVGEITYSKFPKKANPNTAGDDQRKLHSEITQIANQRFVWMTITITAFGAIFGPIYKDFYQNPNQSNIRMFLYTSLVYILILTAIHVYNFQLMKRLRIYTIYLIKMEASDWEEYWKEFRHSQYNKYSHGHRSSHSNLQESQLAKKVDSNAKEGAGRNDDHGHKYMDLFVYPVFLTIMILLPHIVLTLVFLQNYSPLWLGKPYWEVTATGFSFNKIFECLLALGSWVLCWFIWYHSDEDYLRRQEKEIDDAWHEVGEKKR